MARPLLWCGTMDKRDVVIGSPCTLDWRAMTPRDGGRFCGDCKKVVRDLSSLTESEAKALLRGPDTANLCVRYVYDARGQIMFSQKAPDLVPAALLSRARRAAAVVVTAALPLALQACDAENDASSSSAKVDLAQRIAEPSGESMGGAPYMPEPPVTPTEESADASTTDDASADAGPDTTDGGVTIY